MFRDASWWVCSFFIGVFCYMLGTVSNLSDLTVISNIATIIAASATTVAAFYAFQSFQLWEERVKKQHRLEKKTQAIKDLSFAFEVYMAQLIVYLIVHQHRFNTEGLEKEGLEYQELTKANEYLAKFESSLQFAQSFYKEKLLGEYEVISIDKYRKAMEESNTDKTLTEIAEYKKKGRKKIGVLYENIN